MIFKAGDLEPPLRGRLLDGDGNPIDISSGFTITVNVLQPDNTIASWAAAQPVPEDSSEIVGSNGWAEHLWVAGETDLEGDYLAEFIATATVRDRTFPGSAWVAFTIEPTLDVSPATTIVWGQVTAMAPELLDVDSLIRQVVLNHVNGPGVTPSTFGGEGSPTLTLARIYMAAHMATVGLPGIEGTAGPAGPITSEKAGPLSVSYANAAGSAQVSGQASGLYATTYGRAFRQLARGRAAARIPRRY